MKNFFHSNSILLIVVIALAFTSSRAQKGEDLPKYTFHQSKTGGGGYITGIVQDPINTDIIYARCDVAGMFKTTNHGKSWFTINNNMTDWHHHSVQSMAVNPHNPEIIFRCSGDARYGKIFGFYQR